MRGDEDNRKLSAKIEHSPLRDSSPYERDYFERLVSKMSTGILSVTLGCLHFDVLEHNKNPFAEKRINEHSYVLNVGGKDFKRRADRFVQVGEAAIYKDIGDIVMKNDLYIENPQRRHSNKALVATMFRDAADSVFNTFSEDSEKFRTNFPSMSYEGRSYVLRRILLSGVSGPHDEWLENSFGREIHEAAQNVMGKTYSHQFAEGVKNYVGAQLGFSTLLDYSTYVTPEEIEDAWDYHLEWDTFLHRYGMGGLYAIREPICGLRKELDSGDQFLKTLRLFTRANLVTDLFPVETFGIAIRKKKEKLDTIVTDLIENDTAESFIGGCVNVSDLAYVYSRIQSLTGGDAESAYKEDPELSETLKGRLPAEKKDALYTLQMARGFNTTPPDQNDNLRLADRTEARYAIANSLFRTHLLQPPGKQAEFKQYLRDNFFHCDWFILYNAIENSYSDTLTHGRAEP